MSRPFKKACLFFSAGLLLLPAVGCHKKMVSAPLPLRLTPSLGRTMNACSNRSSKVTKPSFPTKTLRES